MESQLVTVPTKKTDNIDWVHPLKSFFTKNYGSYHEFSDEINRFNKLRVDSKSCNRDPIGRDILYKYYGQLELFDLRIPVNDHDGVHVSFTWHDAFKESQKVTQNSIAFEKACVLFNAAAVLTEIGNSSIQEDKDYKLSYQSLQNAAGIYRFIAENFLNAPSNDLQQDSIRGLEQLALAQAQEVFLLKILNGDAATIKDSLVAKLAKAAAELYSGAHDTLDDVKDVPPTWISYCKLKAKLFSAVAYYHHAMAIRDQKAGEAIAFLRQGQLEIEDYKANYSYSKYTSLETNCKRYLELIKKELPILEKDNDFIYHDAIPAFGTLTLKGLEGVKSVSINDQGIDKVVGRDIFEKIIPYAVQEQSSKYTEMAATLLRDEDEKILVSDEELASVLEYLNLPAKLNEVKILASSSQGDDGKLKQLSAVDGNDYDAEPLRAELAKVKRACGDALNEVNKLIDLNNLHYNDRILDIRDNVSKTRQSLIAANETDSKIENLIAPFQRELAVLKSGQVSSYLQNDKSLLDVDVDEKSLLTGIAAVEGNLSELNNIKYEKTKTYKGLRDAVHGDDVSKILILNKNNANHDEIFQSELLKFKPYQERIALLISRQQETISALKRNLKRLLTDENYTALSKEKTDYETNSAKLVKTLENFNKYKGGCRQAQKFYSDLLSFINNLQFEVMQVVNTQNFGQMNLGPQVAAQPPLPPQVNTSNMYRQMPPTPSQQPQMQQQQQQQQQPPLPPLPQQQQQQPTGYAYQRQNSSSIYDQPSNFDPSMYSKYS